VADGGIDSSRPRRTAAGASLLA